MAEDSVSAIIPFIRAGNLIIIKASVDSLAGNFILDTGAPHLVLNLPYFRDYPSTIVQDMEQADVSGTGPPVVRTVAKDFSLGGLQYYNVASDLVDLGHIENSKGIKILGLLGMELFKQCEMIIDYEKNLLYLHRISRKESSSYQHAMLKETSLYNTFPIDLINNKIVARAEIAGKKLKFAIDYAAESNIIDSRLPNKIFENVSISRRVVLNGSRNKKVEALYGKLTGMKMGNEEIGELPFLITNLANTCLSLEGCVDGVLGFDFLSLHRIGFNFVNRKMYIWK